MGGPPSTLTACWRPVPVVVIMRSGAGIVELPQCEPDQEHMDLPRHVRRQVGDEVRAEPAAGAFDLAHALLAGEQSVALGAEALALHDPFPFGDRQRVAVARPVWRQRGELVVAAPQLVGGR